MICGWNEFLSHCMILLSVGVEKIVIIKEERFSFLAELNLSLGKKKTTFT